MRELLKLKDVCKGLSAQYLKEDYAEKVINSPPLPLERIRAAAGARNYQEDQTVLEIDI